MGWNGKGRNEKKAALGGKDHFLAFGVGIHHGGTG